MAGATIVIIMRPTESQAPVAADVPSSAVPRPTHAKMPTARSYRHDRMLATGLGSWPAYTAEEIEAAGRILLSNRVNYWTGEEGRHFEREFAAWVGCDHAIALANGTLALDLALRAVGVGPGDEVVVTPRTFIASVSCVVNLGARPVFADVDCDSGVVTASSIERVLTPRTRGIVCVHLAGWPCEMAPIMRLAEAQSLVVIEDCAQAHGARCDEQMVGTFGHVGAWSFCQDKIMTTGGEGGMVTTRDPDLWERMWSFKDHGKSWARVNDEGALAGFRWVHDSFGSNYRMLEIQAAIGRIQLRRMDEWSARRAAIAARIAEACRRHTALRVPTPPPHLHHAYYRLYAYVEPAMLLPGWSRDSVIEALRVAGVPCHHGSCSEVYLERAFEESAFRPEQRLTNARRLGETGMAFLVHPTLSERDVSAICEAIREVMSRACR